MKTLYDSIIPWAIHMSEIKQNIKIKQGSDRSFGYVFSFIFLLISLYPLLHGEVFKLWFMIAAIIMLAITLLRPSLYKWPNYLWFKFGILLGKIVSPVIMALIFFLVVFPTGLTLRLFNKDILGLKIDKNKETYWIDRDKPMQSMKNQF